jgi:hypothetical protein
MNLFEKPSEKTARRTLIRVRHVQALAGISVVSIWVAACARQPLSEATDSPGFWSGLLHGFLIVFSFIGSLFTDVRIYNFPNSGRWYDFGFLIGAELFLGVLMNAPIGRRMK